MQNLDPTYLQHAWRFVARYEAMQRPQQKGYLILAMDKNNKVHGLIEDSKGPDSLSDHRVRCFWTYPGVDFHQTGFVVSLLRYRQFREDALSAISRGQPKGRIGPYLLYL